MSIEDGGPLEDEDKRPSEGKCSLGNGVGLRFLKELELGKETLRMDKVQQVLQCFGQGLEPAPLPPEKR
jgi:hypothetical protein